MSSGTGTASIPGSQSSSNPSEKVKEDITNGARHIYINATAVTASADAVKEDSVTLVASESLLIANMDGYKTLQFTVSGITTGVYQTQLGYDTNDPPTLVTGEISINDLADVVTGGGQKVLLSVADDGDYMITDLCCKSVYIEFQSGTDTPTITWKARKS